MADYGQSDTSTTILEIDQFPVSEVYVPNGGLTALEGGPSSTDLGGKKSAPASMYVKDGGDVAQGTTTDAANANTVVGQLKQIQTNTNGGATATNQTTANTSLSSVATNTSNTATNTSNINTATGTKTDTKATDGSVTAWSVIALLKGIIDKLLSTLAVTQSGTWTVQPGNTANSTAWKVDGSAVTQPASIADGSSTTLGAKTDTAITDSTTTNSQMSFTKGFVKILADVWDSTNHWLQVRVMNANANGQATLANSSPVAIASDQTPIPTEQWSLYQIMQGHAFATGPNATLATATNANVTVLALSLFNPSLSKNVLIYSIQLFTTENKGAASNLIRLTTTDPGNGTGMTNQLTVTNLKIGGGTTAGVTAWTSPNGITTSITPPGTAFLQVPSGGTQPSVDELLSNGAAILLPAGASNGIAVTTLVSTIADGFSCTAKWIEY